MTPFRPSLIVFDIDNTLTTDNSWARLNAAAGITPEEDYALYLAWHNGEMSYEAWTQKLEEYYKQRGELTKKKAVEALVAYELRGGAADLISTLRSRGYEMLLLTGGFTVTAAAISHELHDLPYLAVSDLR